MFEVEIVSHLWDLEDEGIDLVLDRLQGEIGISGVSVVAAGGPVLQLRRRESVEPRVFRSRGGFFFQPDESKYHSTRCKPTVSGWLKARNPLAKAADACDRHGLGLSAAVDIRAIGRLAQRFPDCATKTAFGDVSPGRVCIHNPDAAELLRGLIADLSANYPLASVELCGLDRVFETDLVDRDDAELLSPGHQELMSVCFCESCLQGAESATDAAVNSAQKSIAAELASDRRSDDTLDELLERDDVLAAYVRDRREAHHAFAASLVETAQCAARLRFRHQSILSVELTPSRVGASGVVCQFDTLPVDASDATLTRLKRMRQDHQECHCMARIPALEPPSADATVIVKSVVRLAENGLDGVQLDHYGRMGETELTAAKQAIRYAKRAADV